MSRFWLTYCDRFGRLVGVVVQDAGTILVARFKAAAADGMDRDTQYRKGHKLDRATARLVPDTVVGRLLSPDEVGELLRKVERQIPKQQPRGAWAALLSGLAWTLFAIVGLFMYRYGTIDILEIYRSIVGR